MLDTARRPEEQLAKEGSEGNSNAATSQGQGSANAGGASAQNGQSPADNAAAVAVAFPRQAPDLVDEVLQVLKTTFPLLILSLETMVDQIHQKFKPPAEEDIYRHICLLLSDAIQVCSYYPTEHRFQLKFADRITFYE
jgi:transformation/transcription domain-associated protein